MNLDNAAQQFAYGLGTATGIVSNISPVISITITSIKTDARIGKIFISFGKGGWYNPSFYANSVSACCSGASLTLQCVSYSSSSCPPIALPLYAVAQTCGAIADILDSTFSIGTAF